MKRSILSMVTLSVVMLGSGCSKSASEVSTNPSPPSNTKTSEQGGYWTLYQTNDVTGDQVTYASPNAVRVHLKETGISYLTKAPKWSLIIYNDENKSYSETTVEEIREQQKRLLGSMSKVAKAVGEKDEVFEKGKNGTVGGLNAVQYISKTHWDDGGTTVVESWYTTDIASPESAAHIFNKGSTASDAKKDLPKNATLIRMTSTKDNVKLVALDTTRFDRSPIPDNVFEMPVGYKKVKNALLE